LGHEPEMRIKIWLITSHEHLPSLQQCSQHHRKSLAN
jgi:hypothetical protein